MAKILLVEDDNNLREIYEARLQAEGYTIVSAHDGEEALVVAKAEKPDLIISDVMMPKISGFEMLDILRNSDGMKNVKIMMLTALGQSDDQQRAEKLGADKYLVKSQVTLEDIARVANELLQPGKQPTSPDGAKVVNDTTDDAPSPLADDANPAPATAPTAVATPLPTAPSEPTVPVPVSPAPDNLSTSPATPPTDTKPPEDDSTPPASPEPPTTPPSDDSSPPATPLATPPAEPPTTPSPEPPITPSSDPSSSANATLAAIELSAAPAKDVTTSSPTSINDSAGDNKEPEAEPAIDKAVSSDLELGSLSADTISAKPKVEEQAESASTSAKDKVPAGPLPVPVVGNTPGSLPIDVPKDDTPVVHPDQLSSIEASSAPTDDSGIPAYSPQPTGKKVIVPLSDSETPPDIHELLRREEAKDIMTDSVSPSSASPDSPAGQATVDISRRPFQKPLSSEPPAMPNPVASAATDVDPVNAGFDPNKIAL